MKTRFTTCDLYAILRDLEPCVGMRVVNVYDVDSKTYLLKLMKPDSKAVILFESGSRIFATDYDFPKSLMPSGFAMKLRKHIKKKRLESIAQVGSDRIVDMQFGSGEVACHVIVELYDRGNVILTDHEHVILNVLRPRTDKDTDVKFAVRERYPFHLARSCEAASPLIFDRQKLCDVLRSARGGDYLRKVLNPHVIYGASILEHFICESSSQLSQIIPSPSEHTDEYISSVFEMLQRCEKFFVEFKAAKSIGVIIMKLEPRLQAPAKAATSKDAEAQPEYLETFLEFHPFLLKQHEALPHKILPSFNAAVDLYFSQLEAQKIDQKAVQQEKAALAKVEKVRADHEASVKLLKHAQRLHARQAELIEFNRELVDRSILVINQFIANQLNWMEIQQLVNEARARQDPAALAIKQLKLDINHFSLLLRDPYASPDPELEPQESAMESENPMQKSSKKSQKKAKKSRQSEATALGNDENLTAEKQLLVDVDLSIGAHANARRYYELRRLASVKEAKTVAASAKALKSAEAKAQETLKQVAVKTTVSKRRRLMWFEKFLWFISSENYLIIGGRDQQQNELLVKRYLKPGDIYCHADIRGAASVIVKNRSMGNPIPPKTVIEAGAMAICNSAAWDAKVVTSAWWVNHDQVSKTAPSGEYLTTGSFMIRGKKNFMPPCQLVMGFGILFRLDEESMQNHIGERQKVAEETPGDTFSATGNTDMVHEEAIAADNMIDNEFPDVTIPSLSSAEGSVADLLDKLGGNANDYSIVQTGKAPKMKTVTISAADARKDRKKKMSKNVGSDGKHQNRENVVPSVDESASQNSGQIKRGQKFKNKKIKEKYRNQDEEERNLRMQLLASTGQRSASETSMTPTTTKPKQQQTKRQQETSKTQKQPQVDGKHAAAPAKVTPPMVSNKLPSKQDRQQETVETHNACDSCPTVCGPTAEVSATSQHSVIAVGELIKDELKPGVKISETPIALENQEQLEYSDNDDDDNTDEESENLETDDDALKLINSLSGCPLPNDVLLYAVPVCGAYSALGNYKFKVKLTPGSGKRGKATKTALQIFLKEKSLQPLEKDLLKSLADLDLSRNLPGKVKLSAPMLQAVKQQKKTTVVK